MGRVDWVLGIEAGSVDSLLHLYFTYAISAQSGRWQLVSGVYPHTFDLAGTMPEQTFVQATR